VVSLRVVVLAALTACSFPKLDLASDHPGSDAGDDAAMDAGADAPPTACPSVCTAGCIADACAAKLDDGQ